jgi:hypothetical protein
MYRQRRSSISAVTAADLISGPALVWLSIMGLLTAKMLLDRLCGIFRLPPQTWSLLDMALGIQFSILASYICWIIAVEQPPPLFIKSYDDFIGKLATNRIHFMADHQLTVDHVFAPLKEDNPQLFNEIMHKNPTSILLPGYSEIYRAVLRPNTVVGSLLTISGESHMKRVCDVIILIPERLAPTLAGAFHRKGLAFPVREAEREVNEMDRKLIFEPNLFHILVGTFREGNVRGEKNINGGNFPGGNVPRLFGKLYLELIDQFWSIQLASKAAFVSRSSGERRGARWPQKCPISHASVPSKQSRSRD